MTDKTIPVAAEPPVEVKTRLVRNQSGGVHFRGCPYAGKTSVSWLWAEGRDDSEWLNLSWLHSCSYCFGAIERVRAALTQSALPTPASDLSSDPDGAA